jgi:Calcineurin-like phosphoesterase
MFSLYRNSFASVNFMRKSAVLFLLFILFLYPVSARLAAPDQEARIVAIADIHGAYDAFVAIAQRAGIIGANRQWGGGKTTFVQLGDILDRGPKSRATMDLLMQLENQAPAVKGKAIVLLGNHEIMNLIGDLRYVPPEEYANYADAQSQKRQQDAYAAYQELKRNQLKAEKQAVPTFTADDEKTWKEAHPLGFVEQRQAFEADGKYGSWLRKHFAILQLNGIVFLHGGLNPEISNLSINELNRRVALEIEQYDLARKYLLAQKLILPFSDLKEVMEAADAEATRFSQSGPDADSQKIKLLKSVADVDGWVTMNQGGPLWFRGFSSWTDEEGEQNLAALLTAYKVHAFVVGHTVQPGGQIRARFHNQLFLIDTGMLDSTWFEGGRASALQIKGTHFTVIYPDQTVPLP